jgi:inosose dehydratase
MIRFGVSPIAWINDDMPELGGDTPVETVLADARDLRFSGIELGGKFPKDPAVLGPLLARHRLELVGGWYSASLLLHSAQEEIARLQPHLELLKGMGSRVFICAETSNAIHGDRSRPLSSTPRLQASEWPAFGARLTAVADYIAAQGLRFAYHHHLGTVIETTLDLEQFIQHTGPSVGLTLDTGHAALAEIDAVAVVRSYPERLAHVHCKDVRRDVFASLKRRNGSFLDGVLEGMFTVPGDGALDYDTFMKVLAEVGYGGWIIIEAEQDPAKAPPRGYAELGLRTLDRAARSAGLKIEVLDSGRTH